MQDTIALICDCDQTLAPNTTDFFLKKNGIDTDPFWEKIEKMVSEGWDPPQAWMNQILTLINDGTIKQNSNEKLRELGKEIPLYSGVETLASELRSEIKTNEDFVKANISLECYIVSQGIEEILKGCPGLSGFQVYASQFSETDGKISAIKSTVTFTEKTKFLFAIHKGISADELRNSPYLVNKFMEEKDKPIPFNHMIYLGDSENDVPCFSMLNKMKGYSISVDPIDQFHKGFQLTRGNRTRVGPYSSNYASGSDLRSAISYAIKDIGGEITYTKKSKHQI